MYFGRFNHTCDYGASRILGTRGSTLGYINTGNPYDRRYYNAAADNVVHSEKVRKRKTVDKIITAIQIKGI